jgi:hypothetical protein
MFFFMHSIYTDDQLLCSHPERPVYSKLLTGNYYESSDTAQITLKNRGDIFNSF